MPPYGGRGVVGAALYKRVSRLSLRGRQAVAIRVPRPFFKSILKWQFENPTIHQSVNQGSIRGRFQCHVEDVSIIQRTFSKTIL